MKILLKITDAVKIFVLAVQTDLFFSDSGVAPKDLDAFVKFEFHYPSTVSVCPDFCSSVRDPCHCISL